MQATWPKSQHLGQVAFPTVKTEFLENGISVTCPTSALDLEPIYSKRDFAGTCPRCRFYGQVKEQLVNRSRLQGIYPCSVERIGAYVPLTTNIGVLLNLLRWDSEWRDRAGFNGHPNLIPDVNLLMQ
jgi:hypothetical protein